MVLHYTYHLSRYLSLLIEFYQPDDRLRSRILVVQLVFEFQLTTTGLTGLKDNGVVVPFSDPLVRDDEVDQLLLLARIVGWF